MKRKVYIDLIGGILLILISCVMFIGMTAFFIFVTIEAGKYLLGVIMSIICIYPLIFLVFKIFLPYYIQWVFIDEEKIEAYNCYGKILTIKWTDVTSIKVRKYSERYFDIKLIEIYDHIPRFKTLYFAMHKKNKWTSKHLIEQEDICKLPYTKKFVKLIKQYCDKEFEFIDCKDKFNKS